jgi:hypothetical protein
MAPDPAQAAADPGIYLYIPGFAAAWVLAIIAKQNEGQS